MTENAELKDRARRIVCEHVEQVRRIMELYSLEDFEPEATDVFIVSWMKSGTTLMQQLIYQLLCAKGKVGSDADGEKFSDISEVVPFADVRKSTGVRESRNGYSPRVWKSHSAAGEMGEVDKGCCKTLYCVRDGLQVAGSYLDFALDWISEEVIEGEELRKAVYVEFFEKHFVGVERGSEGCYVRFADGLFDWFGHVKGWMESGRDDMLFVVYEDVVKDIEGTVRVVAKFLGMETDEEIVKKVAAKCDREYMARDKRFNDRLISKLLGWKEDGGVRVRVKDAKGFKQVGLPKELVEQYAKKFSETFGVQTYEELARELRKRNCAYFGE